jgi:replicative DNA helicase
MNSIGENEVTAEQSVLGAILLDPNVLDEIMFLEERDFTLIRHQSIYEVMRYLEQKGKPVDIITIVNAVGKQIGNIGGGIVPLRVIRCLSDNRKRGLLCSDDPF